MQDEPIEDEGGFDIEEMLSAIKRQWRLVAGIAVLVTSLAVAYAMSLPNYYTATATVQIDTREKKILHIDGVLSDLKVDPPTIESEVEVLTSTIIAQKVIDRLSLRSDPEFNTSSLLSAIPAAGAGIIAAAPPKATPAASHKAPATTESTVDFFRKETETQHAVSRDIVVQSFLNNVSARRIRNSLVIEITFMSRDPVKAARIANTIVDVYIERQFDEKQRATEIAISLIEEKLKSLRERLAASERRIAQYKSDNDIFDAKGDTLQNNQLSSEMEALVIARNQTAQAKSRYEQATRMAANGDPNEAIAEVLQNGTVSNLRTSLSNALRQHAELSTKYGPLHPEIRRIEADVAKARTEFKLEVAKVLKTLKMEFDVARDRQQQLETHFEGLKQRVTSSKSQKWELHHLERDAKANNLLYEALLSRKKQAEETLGLHFPDAKVITQADVPLQPSHPKRKKIVLIAAASGLALGLGLVILLNQLAGGITNSERIGREFALPHLASVPNLQRRSDGLDSPLKAMRIMLTNPHGIYADSIREIAYELDWRRHNHGPRIILITSAQPAEGKSLIACNLAHYLALTGHRPLLIDADMRKQTLTSVLGATGRNGFYEALCKGQPIESAILNDPHTGLHFMPAASTPQTIAPPTEILASRHTQALLHRLKRQYDTIIIDAPALLPVIDGRILASHVDQILFTMNWYLTPKRAVRKALRTIARSSQKIVGIVINGTDPAEYKSRLQYRTALPGASQPPPRHRRAA